MINLLSAMMLSFDMQIPSSVHYYYARILYFLNTVFLPVAVLVFIILQFRGRLPRFHLRETAVTNYPAFIISFRRIVSALGLWLLFGIIPVAAITVFLSNPKFITYVPWMSMYLEITLLYMFYRSLIIRRKDIIEHKSI
jgi:hypothetical protein